MGLAQAAQAGACKMQQLVQLPVTMVGTRPTVPVTINGTELRFLLDSGAFFSMIATPAMKALGLKGVDEPRLRVAGVGGQVVVQSTTVREVGLGGAPFRQMDFLVTEVAGGPGVSGLLGLNVLGAADVEYDLAHGVVRFFRPRDCETAMLAYWSDGMPRVLGLLYNPSARTHKIQAIGALNGQAIRLIFDTGAEVSVLTLEAAARAGVTPASPGAVHAGAGRGFSETLIDTWVAPFDALTLGGETIARAWIHFGGLDMKDTDMLLGADFFLSHRVYVANSQRKIYFTANGDRVTGR